MLRTVVELLDKRLATEHGLLKVVTELDSGGGTCLHALVAEGATAQVIDVLVEFHLLLAVGHLDHALGHRDGAIGARTLARATRYAAMTALLVVDKLQRAAKAFRNLQRGAIFGILLRHLASNEFATGNRHSLQQATNACEDGTEIFFNAHVSFSTCGYLGARPIAVLLFCCFIDVPAVVSGTLFYRFT